MSYPDPNAHTAPSGAHYTTNDTGWITWSDDWGSLMSDILSGALPTERRSGPYGHTDYRPVWLAPVGVPIR